MRILSVALLPLLLVCPFLSAASEAAAPAVAEQPTELLAQPAVIGAETALRWKGLLPLVSLPEARRRLFPGQHITIALLAQGRDRDQLLAGLSCDLLLDYDGAVQAFQGLKPAQVRRLKADGADYTRFVMKEVKADAKLMDLAISEQSIALFELDWAVPPQAQDGVLRVAGTARFASGQTVALRGGSVEVWSAAKVASLGRFPDAKAAGAWMMGYYRHPEPGRTLHAIRAFSETPDQDRVNVVAFLVTLLQTDPEAIRSVLEGLDREAPQVRQRALLLLSEAGVDVAPRLASLPAEEQLRFRQVRGAVPHLSDPFDLNPDPAFPRRIPEHLDMLWSRFLATGDPAPVQAIVRLLAWRDDWKTYEKRRDEFQKTGRQVGSPDAAMLRAMAYSSAGWSLGSFYRSHPLVADYVDAWEQDPGVPAVIREELAGLITNPAFEHP
nr:hypothetical protein [uncultured Holophaga sp.]